MMTLVFFYLSYAFVYVKHFVLHDNIYAKNLSIIVLVVYWSLATLMIFVVFSGGALYRGKDQEEKITLWKNAARRGKWRKASAVMTWLVVIGMGVMGEWRFFVPLAISGICGEVFRSQCGAMLNEHRRKTGLPVEPKEPARPKRPKSRYSMIKE